MSSEYISYIYNRYLQTNSNAKEDPQLQIALHDL